MERLDEAPLFRIISDNIKKRRTELGLNQAVLAGQVGLSRTSLVNIEAGRQHPSLILLWDIAKALDVELSELIPSRKEFNTVNSGISGRYIVKTTSDVMQRFKQTVLDQSSHESQEAESD